MCLSVCLFVYIVNLIVKCVSSLQLAWAPGRGVKGAVYKSYWELELGVSFVPWELIRSQKDLNEIAEGGWIDPTTCPPGTTAPLPPQGGSYAYSTLGKVQLCFLLQNWRSLPAPLSLRNQGPLLTLFPLSLATVTDWWSHIQSDPPPSHWYLRLNNSQLDPPHNNWDLK